MHDFIRTSILLFLKLLARIFYTFEVEWMGPVPPKPWNDVRIATVLNHTSLYEWLLAGGFANHFLKRIATRGYVPVADITISRAFYGRFIQFLAPHFVSITREADHTWQAVIDSIPKNSMIIIFPEGRMKRATGLDKRGQPMTVRGGIVDLLDAVPEGRMLLVYSGGLHHIQVPGQKIPKLFKKIRIACEFVDIAQYRATLMAEAGEESFRQAVREDLDSRRDRHCARLETFHYPTADEAPEDRRKAS